MYPKDMTTAPIVPIPVRIFDVIHRGCLSTKIIKAFFSTPFKIEVCILTELSLFFSSIKAILNYKPFPLKNFPKHQYRDIHPVAQDLSNPPR